ncbi:MULTISPECIES: serine hydrolase [unclassified Janthinobacterium]|uniref:serine hydrolase domain-containing protein n=1 Tax=unclassified Janthinobacterium TaxID=2610881 RepID=UPI001616BCCE|nr:MULTISPECIES: serine hydrolase domain-containing protein [unclassified Janthinobacterium]MBB5608125.1 CubicO group peptidase (beta-lactamase class C family) [Janthinobacterium sp. S3T4]MBB5613451.1 CubicO group peptidase (beta-lactamase class C family) [Janthinobacterium sp. S3M3]
MSIDLSSVNLPSRIDTLLDTVVQQQRLVGAVVLVRHQGREIYRRATGYLDREAQLPMRGDALFRLASVSKPIVSTAALALVGQGRLTLDDLVARWLPYFQPRQPDGAVAQITVRHLLTHTAGLDYGFFQPPGGPYAQAGVSDGMDALVITLEDNLRRLATVPLAYAPGERWAYSIATDVLGAVIEHASGLPLAQAVCTLVTAPLAMHDTGFIAVDRARLAVAYADRTAPDAQPRRLLDVGDDHLPFLDGMAGFQLSPARALDALAHPSGGAGMVGSADDFMRLLEALRLGGAPLLPSELVHQLGTSQTGNAELPFWPGRGFGLGFTVLNDPQLAATPEAAGTWRMGGTYGHSWFVDPARELSVVAFSNTALEGMAGAFVGELCQAVYGVQANP